MREGRAIRDTELPEQSRDEGLHDLLGQPEIGGDVLVLVTTDDGSKHLLLPSRQAKSPLSGARLSAATTLLRFPWSGASSSPRGRLPLVHVVILADAEDRGLSLSGHVYPL